MQPIRSGCRWRPQALGQNPSPRTDSTQCPSTKLGHVISFLACVIVPTGASRTSPSPAVRCSICKCAFCIRPRAITRIAPTISPEPKTYRPCGSPRTRPPWFTSRGNHIAPKTSLPDQQGILLCAVHQLSELFRRGLFGLAVSYELDSLRQAPCRVRRRPTDTSPSTLRASAQNRSPLRERYRAAFSSSITSIVARASTAVTGLRPKVEIVNPW